MANSGQTPRPLREVVCRTTWVEAPRLSRALEARVLLASETFQWTGSFKFRAAYHLAAQVPHRHILTASSGNFGQALACACQMLGKTTTVVMPLTSARVKIDAVREFGGVVDLVDVTQISRRARVQALARQHPDAYVASAYDDPWVIAGNATLGEELAQSPAPLDAILAPAGGGGLTSGIITGLRSAGQTTPVYAVEPLMANDLARSWREGRLVALEDEPATLADGARVASVGQRNWAILKDGLAGVIEVTEDQIAHALRLLFHLANLKAEPTGALPLAALGVAPGRFRGQTLCCVVSGGNVDPGLFARLIAAG